MEEKSTFLWIRDTCAILGSIACIFVWLKIEPSDLRIPINLPHWLWLALAILLYAIPIYSSFRKHRSYGPNELSGTIDTFEAFKNPRWQIVSKKKFINEVIDVDGKSFRDCSFRNVTLLYHGTAPTELVGEVLIENGTVLINSDNPAVNLYMKLYQFLTSGPNAEIKHEDDPAFTKNLVKNQTLRERTIALFDRLGTFMKEFKKLEEITQEAGESNEDFVTRRLRNWLQQSQQMAAGFRLNFEDDMRHLNDEIQISYGTCYPLISSVEKAARSCTVKIIEEMRQSLWSCAETMGME